MVEDDQPEVEEEVPTKGDQELLNQAMKDNMAPVAATSEEVHQEGVRWLIDDNSEVDPNKDMHDVSSQGSYCQNPFDS